MKKTILYLVLFLSLGNHAFSQSSAGTTFWISFMENLNLAFNDFPSFAIYVEATAEADLLVEVPATGLKLPFKATPNQVTEFRLPEALWYSEGSERIDGKGIKITSTEPVKMYAIHYRLFFSESSIVLPESALGTNYLVTAYEDDRGESPSSLVITSTTDNNEIEIIPSAITNGLRPDNIPFTITLQRGQNYQIQSRGDLSGTQIRSLSNQKIAVFAGAQQATIGNCSADSHVFDQMYPVDSWKSDFYCVPFAFQGGDVFKVLALEDSTAIFIDCEQRALLQSGEYYTVRLTDASLIQSNGRISVSQFNESAECNTSGLGDPNMLQLLPLPFQGRQFRFFSDGRDVPTRTESYFNVHFANIITKQEHASSIRIDGSSANINFTPFISDPNYVYAQVRVSPGEHVIESEHLFQAYSYGFGSFDAYTHHLGYDEIVSNDSLNLSACLDLDIQGILCQDSIIRFSYKSTFNPISWEWDFGDGTISNLSEPTHQYTSPGSYTVSLILRDSSNRTQEAQSTITIIDCTTNPCFLIPEVDISFTGFPCVDGILNFTAITNDPIQDYSWNFGNGETAQGMNTSLAYPESGTYNLQLTVRDSLNCSFTFTDTLDIFDCLPCETFGDLQLEVSGSRCIDSTITLIAPVDTLAQPLIEFAWIIGDELITDDFTPSILLSDLSSFEVFFTAKDIFDCEYFGVAIIQVLDCSERDCSNLPRVDLISSAGNCVNDTINISTQTNADLVSFEWTSNIEVAGVRSIFSITPTEAGVLKINFTGRDAQGCTYRASTEFDIIECSSEDCSLLPPLAIEFEGELIVGNIINLRLSEADDLTNIQWNTSSGATFTDPSIDFLLEQAGQEIISVSATQISNGCSRAGRLNLFVEELDVCTVLPELSISGLSEVDCRLENSYQVETTANIMDILWQVEGENVGNDTILNLTFTEAGTAQLLVEIIDDNGCLWTDSLTITVGSCECIIAFPNAFTPNGDQTNDCFAPVYTQSCGFTFFRMQIFSRWGQKLFESFDIENCWDGTFNGKAMPSEVYVYLIEYQFEGQASVQTEAKDVLLLR